MVLWWSGLPTNLVDALVDQVVSDVDTMMQHVIREDIIALAATNIPLRAVLRVAGEEIAAGLIYARWLRLPDRNWSWRVGDVDFKPAVGPAADPGGLIERGTTRLRPYLVQDPKVGPLVSVVGVGGKQGAGGPV